MRDDSCGTGSVMLAFVVGGLVGAGLAMLLTPVSGPEARRRIREFKDDVQDSAEDYIEGAKEKAEHYVDSAKERVSSAVGRGREFVDEKKSAISKAVEAGKDAYAREKEKA